MGDVALVTSKLHTVGHLQDHSFDVHERQTDVLVWRDGGWQSVLLPETIMRDR